MDVRPVRSSDIEPMAALLSERHQDHWPLGATHVLADPTRAAQSVRNVLAGGVGYAAMKGSALAGFMVVPYPEMPGRTIARLGQASHTATAEDARSVYRALYEASSADLVAAGITYHSVPVLFDHPAAMQALFELEFGMDQIDGLAAVDRNSTDLTSTAVRPATEADVDAVLDLAIELQRFHSRAPMFAPALDFDVAGMRSGIEAGLAEDRSVVLVFEVGGELRGMIQAGPDSAYRDTVDIGMNVVAAGARTSGVGTAMLQHLLGWAASRRYRYCSVGWTSSNLISDAFYRSRGFMPVRARVHRRIDSRVCWANDALDDRHFGRRRADS